MIVSCSSTVLYSYMLPSALKHTKRFALRCLFAWRLPTLEVQVCSRQYSYIWSTLHWLPLAIVNALLSPFGCNPWILGSCLVSLWNVRVMNDSPQFSSDEQCLPSRHDVSLSIYWQMRLMACQTGWGSGSLL